MAPIGVAVVGTGFGARVHVPALRAAGFDVVALVGTDADRTARRAERREVRHACTSLAEALSLPGVDAVTIAAPPAAHADLALEAIAAGRHVICEKPFALDAAQATGVLDAARAAGVVHALGHELRWFPERVAVLRALRAGAVGEARLVSVVDFVSLLTNPQIRMPAWYFDPAAGGGWLGASGSHAIDMLRLWLGEFASVTATTCVAHGDPAGADDSFVLHFTLRSGAIGVLQQTGGAWRGVGHTVISGTTGTLAIDGGRAWVADADGRRPLDEPADDGGAGGSEDPNALAQMTNMELPAYTRLCEAFARAIRGEEPRGDVPLPTFDDGVAAMRVMDAARQSAAAGGALVTV
jgi:predicted dehydrogenase